MLKSLSLVFQKLRSTIMEVRSRPDVIFHNPDSSKPHDLDDPFFDEKVQQQLGQAIASSAHRNPKSEIR